MIFVLQNIRSAWNVGQVFRTADALGAQVVCLGYTATPDGHAKKLIAKTAIGAEKTVKWHKCDNHGQVFQLFPKPDYQHIAIEINSSSLLVYEYLADKSVVTGHLCLWLGNEIAGIAEDALALCDTVLHLPMQGSKESLNVSNVATTIGYLFEYNQFCNTK